jgi:hypothetical protein
MMSAVATQPDTGIKPVLLPPRLRTLEPVLLTGLVTATLVVLVAFKLWSAQRYLRAGT